MISSGTGMCSRVFIKSWAKTARLCSKRNMTSRPFLSPASVSTEKWLELTRIHWGSAALARVLTKTTTPQRSRIGKVGRKRVRVIMAWPPGDDSGSRKMLARSFSRRRQGHRRFPVPPGSPFSGVELPFRPARVLGDDRILVLDQFLEHWHETPVPAVAHCDHGVPPQTTALCAPHGRPAEFLPKLLSTHFRQPFQRRIDQTFLRLKFRGGCGGCLLRPRGNNPAKVAPPNKGGPALRPTPLRGPPR